MNATVEDLRATIIPKSDQLNSEQLLGGPMTVTVTDVKLGSSEDQPVKVHYDGENGRPFLPCKTMRKVLIHAWGKDGTKWPGRSMTLYNDPTVKWGGEDVGGIRISHMTHIERDIKVSLTTTRGKKAKYEVRKLESQLAGQLVDIARSPTLVALKDNFEAAYKATKVQAERDQLTAAKDKRKGELQAPPKDAPADDYNYGAARDLIVACANRERLAELIDQISSEAPDGPAKDALMAAYRERDEELAD